MKAYYEKLLSYNLLIEHGGEEMKQKVQALIDEYHQFWLSGMKSKDAKWEFRKKEEDELRGNEFQTIILNKETADKSIQLEVVADFDFSDSRYNYALNNANFRLVRVYEKEHKSMFSDAKKDEFFLVKKEDGYSLQTVSGNVLWPNQSKVTKEKRISFAQDEKE